MTKKEQTKYNRLYLHYSHGVQDTEVRRTRQNGWNDVIDSYMNKLPADWPFLSITTDPRVRTTILEKTARLLNAKLRGRLVPRENGDIIKARIQNALLDFQWNYVQKGGSMIEKVADADQTTRIYGSAFTYCYWDNDRNTNETKNINPNDIWFDGSATHIKNARWVQVREWTTVQALEDQGYDTKRLKYLIKKGEIVGGDRHSTAWTDLTKANKGIVNREGEIDNPKNPTIEVVTEWTKTKRVLFAPRYGVIIDDGKNPYEHKQIPIAMLRYYPLGSDIYGESEVESVLPLQRAINAFLCVTNDNLIITSRPPLKISSKGVRIETIEYGPGAQWIMQNPNMVQEMQFSDKAIANFNTIYPALVAAFNTAMGDRSLGVSNVIGKFAKKTATEVNATEMQQNNRDQYNQLYLSEYLKDIMMMWLSNNKQYLFDDPTKHYYILKVIGKENIKYFQAMQLDNTDIPPEAMNEIVQTIEQNPNGVSDEDLQKVISDVSIPEKPVITNPNASPEQYKIKKKFNVSENGEEGELYITPDDFEGVYDYIPDVSSMAAGAGNQLKQARKTVLETVLNPAVQQMLQMQGETVNIKEVLINAFEDAGYKDAESLFTKNEQNQAGQINPPGQGVAGASPIPQGANVNQGMGNIPQAVPNQPVPAGIPQA